MEVVIKSLTEEGQSRRENCDEVEITFNGKEVFYVYEGDMENNNLGQNFNDVFLIGNLLKTAYEAGKCGEEFSLDHLKVDDI